MKKATLSITLILLSSAGVRDQHLCYTQLGRRTRIDGQRQKTVCIIVPSYSVQFSKDGYTLRFLRTCRPVHIMTNPCMPLCLFLDTTAPPQSDQQAQRDLGQLNTVRNKGETNYPR